MSSCASHVAALMLNECALFFKVDNQYSMCKEPVKENHLTGVLFKVTIIIVEQYIYDFGPKLHEGLHCSHTADLML